MRQFLQALWHRLFDSSASFFYLQEQIEFERRYEQHRQMAFQNFPHDYPKAG